MIVPDLKLQPGDVLVVHCGADLTSSDRKRIAAEINRAGIDNTVLVVQSEPRFDVIRAPPADKD